MADSSHNPDKPTGLRAIAATLKPTLSMSQLLAALLCALLGFALVAQLRLSGEDELATLRQDDLVLLLDDVTSRADQMEAEVLRLQASRDELISGADSERVALDLALARAGTEGILSGRLEATGPGIHITVDDPNRTLRASHLFNLLEELRNAGAEAAQVNGVRLVASSSFEDVAGKIQVDGQLLTAPFEWTVIGDPATLDRALEIHGGALPTIRREGGTTEAQMAEVVVIDATVQIEDPRFAQPVDSDEG